jgi:hypothetical protein
MNPCGTLNQQVRNERIDRIESIVTNDPWASVGSAQTAPAPTAPQTDAAASSLSDSYESEQSSLFGPAFESHPVLFTLADAPGTKIKGKIISKPRDVQSTCHPSESPDRKSRLKQYWVTDSTGRRMPGLDAVDPRTGKPNDPVNNLVVSLETDRRDPSIPGDDGRRTWFLQGSYKAPKGHKVGDPTTSAKLALKDALQLASQAGIRIGNDNDMLDKYLEVHRIDRVEPSVTTSPWLWQARITAS